MRNTTQQTKEQNTQTTPEKQSDLSMRNKADPVLSALENEAESEEYGLPPLDLSKFPNKAKMDRLLDSMTKRATK